MTGVRCQRTEDGGQKTEDGGRAEDGARRGYSPNQHELTFSVPLVP